MPAGATYEPLATTTVSGSSTNTITFNSISSSYTDLVLILSGITASATYIKMNFNNDTSSLYSDTVIWGSGTAAASARESTVTRFLLGGGLTTSSTLPHFFRINVFSYAGSTNKTILAEMASDKNGSGSVERTVGLYRSTTAISRIDLVPNSGNYSDGYTATLYGIKAA